MTRLALPLVNTSRDRRARLDRFLADRCPVMKFLSFLIVDEAAVLPNVKMIARHLAAY